MVAFDTRFWWYASRASGVVLWLVLVASVVWGFAVSTRLVRRKGLPAWMLDLHKHLGTLAVVFTVAHLVTLWADSFVEFGWRELFVPMASPWRPGAVTWGIIAFYLLAVVQITSWCMKRLPRRLWHTIHMLSLPLLVTGTVHGILAGADWSNRVVQWGLVVLCSVVVWLATFRVLAPRKDPATTDRLAAARAAAAAAKQAAAPPADGAAAVTATPGRRTPATTRRATATPVAPPSPPAATVPPPPADRSIWAPPAVEPETTASSRS